LALKKKYAKLRQFAHEFFGEKPIGKCQNQEEIPINHDFKKELNYQNEYS